MKNIRIGNHYNVKYTSGGYIAKEIDNIEGYVKSYCISNKLDAPIFKGILRIMEDGRAIMNVNYISYSGVKNKYKNYFDKNGNEIIHTNNSEKEERKYFNSL